MTSKPTSGDGYDSEQMERVKQICLYMATRLGDLLDEVVVVGGLVPGLLVNQNPLPAGLSPHVGTLDLDMGLALAVLNQERYRDLSERLRDAGFTADTNEQGHLTMQRWIIDTGQRVTVDFLIPPVNGTDKGGTVRHIESDFAAIVTPAL